MHRITKAEIEAIKAMPSCQVVSLKSDGSRCAIGKLTYLLNAKIVYPINYLRDLRIRPETIWMLNDGLSGIPANHAAAVDLLVSELVRVGQLEIINEKMPEFLEDKTLAAK